MLIKKLGSNFVAVMLLFFFVESSNATTIEYKILYPDNEVKTYVFTPETKRIQFKDGPSCSFLEINEKTSDPSAKGAVVNCDGEAQSIIGTIVYCLNPVLYGFSNAIESQKKMLIGMQSKELIVQKYDLKKKTNSVWKITTKCIYE